VGLALALFVPVPGPATDLALAPPLLSLIGMHPSDRVNWLSEAMLGAGLPAFLLWGCGWIYEKVRHREGLGLGDVKLIAMIGAFLGLSDALSVFLIGSLGGSILGYAYIRITHKDASNYEIPFGTFLALAALLFVVLSTILSKPFAPAAHSVSG
jgi:leader peptidase (prepilin peptidase)/N-methyltransferase